MKQMLNALQVQRPQSPDRLSYLQLAPEAITRQSMRSLNFDPHDLPPIDAQVRDFLETDHKPYECRVDQLLDDPRYGETWTRFWRDRSLARYADTAAYERFPSCRLIAFINNEWFSEHPDYSLNHLCHERSCSISDSSNFASC